MCFLLPGYSTLVVQARLTYCTTQGDCNLWGEQRENKEKFVNNQSRVNIFCFPSTCIVWA